MGRFDTNAGPNDGIKIYLMATYELSTSSENHSLLSALNVLIYIIFVLHLRMRFQFRQLSIQLMYPFYEVNSTPIPCS